MRHRIFTRAEIAAYVLSVYGTDMAPDETVTIGLIVRLKAISPPVWIADYTRRMGIGATLHTFHSKAIVMAGRDFHGNAELCLPDTIILPEEVPQEEKRLFSGETNNG